MTRLCSQWRGKVVSRQTKTPLLNEYILVGMSPSLQPHCVFLSGAGVLQTSVLQWMGIAWGIKMRCSLHPHGTYCLFHGDMKTTAVWQVLWKTCVWGPLGPPVGVYRGRRVCGRDRQGERHCLPSVLYRSIIRSAFKQADLLLPNPLAHWPITRFPFIAKLIKILYAIAISNSSLSVLS